MANQADTVPADAERVRLDEADNGGVAWRRWGPYLAERAWGTVREDYSADGDAWSSFPFDHAASRTYRWGEDGMAGICDEDQTVCLALALWNGVDPILKERPFGLTGEQGNHGEDVKDYWWYLDATPTSSWLRWRYHYPQRRFPYEDLLAENHSRTRLQPEYELVDTGVFAENRYWVVTVEWAKAGPEELYWRINVHNAGPEEATIEVIPTIWFRNRWSFGVDPVRPVISIADGPPGTTTLSAEHPRIGKRLLQASGGPEALFCDNETNAAKLWGSAKSPPYPKDGISDHVIHSAATINPARTGTKAGLRYTLTVPAGQSAEVRLRFLPDDDEPLAESSKPPASQPDGAEAVDGAEAADGAKAVDGAEATDDFDQVMSTRLAEADRFYAGLADDVTIDEARIMRQAFAGMLWSKQFFHYDIERWLSGDPGQPAPPEQRRHGRNADWPHLNNHDVISMPDSWEYPWYASWDLAFHCVALAHLDPTFAKNQLILLCREWYMHPNGQLPAYEWNFGDVNPPVQAWAALRVAEIDASSRRARGESDKTDFGFLERVFHKLLLNFTWWVNRKDEGGNNVFEGGFLGLDNIGLFDRSKPLPVAGHLEQSDGTAWMAMYCLNLLEMALLLAGNDPIYEDVASKFFEHFTYIASAMRTQGLWDDTDGFFYDVVSLDNGTRFSVRACSMVGVIPLFAVTLLDPARLQALSGFRARMEWFLANKPDFGAAVADWNPGEPADWRMLAVVDSERLKRVLARVLDPDELLSGSGLRSLSHRHGELPLTLDLGGQVLTLDYEPAESTNYLFGGNSNWRGPVWFPLNYLFIETLGRYHRYFGPSWTVEYPTGSGTQMNLQEIADDLARRLVSIFLEGDDGRRPVFGGQALFADANWKDQIPFHEYFHGETGAGLGASHQTGWTGLVADLIADRRLGGRR